MTDFPYRLRVTRPGTGAIVQDPDTGVFTPPARQVVYDGGADVQDTGEAVPRTATGQPAKESDATAFLEHEAAVLAIEPGDVAEVFYPNSDRWAEGDVKFVREIDAVLLIRFR